MAPLVVSKKKGEGSERGGGGTRFCCCSGRFLSVSLVESLYSGNGSGCEDKKPGGVIGKDIVGGGNSRSWRPEYNSLLCLLLSEKVPSHFPFLNRIDVVDMGNSRRIRLWAAFLFFLFFIFFFFVFLE